MTPQLTMEKKMRQAIDVTVEDHGSLCLIRPESEGASEWVEEYVEGSALWWGDSLAIEARYAPDLVSGMAQDGLVVGGWFGIVGGEG